MFNKEVRNKMTSSDSQKKVTIWLAGLVVLVFVMITVGGTTRLTRSGLSIVEWRPITGILPPLSEKDWQDEFAGDKRSKAYDFQFA